MVRVVEQPVHEATISDVIFGSIGLVAILLLAALLLGALLKTQAYRQQIAQALFDAIVAYQQGLKRLNAVAGKKATQ